MYFLDFGDFQVAGASPEPLITVSGRQVTTRPIAGTRPRGADPEEAVLEAELLADEKERAEHVMLVDLGRNDLGRVCEYGSVKVETLMAVEHYSHVMHIVSSVTGTPAPGRRRDGRAACHAARRHALRRAQGPRDADHRRARAGQARRLRRRDRLPQLHRRARHGIHIRTVVVKDGVAHLQAGGGTVADACPSASSWSRSPRPRPCCARSSSPASRATGSSREAAREATPRMATLAACACS
jgi:anthranilate synthase component 1